MTDPRAADTTPLNPPGPEDAEQVLELQGREAHDDQDAVVAATDIERRDAPTDTEVYQGDLEALGGLAVPGEPASLEGLGSLELRDGETADPNVAAEEGQPWVPPSDPPVVADRASEGGLRVAAGFGSTALDEPFDADHHDTALPGQDEVEARVREAITADARTSRIAGLVDIGVAAGTVVLRGRVDDIEDGDLLAEVASAVTGVTTVLDETEVEGL